MRKRTIGSLDSNGALPQDKRRKSNVSEAHNAVSRSNALPQSRLSGFTPVNQAVGVDARRASQLEDFALAVGRSAKPNALTYGTRQLSADAALVSYGSRPSSHSASPMLPQALTPIPTLRQVGPQSMRYRGKVWTFDSIIHKATVLEKIILQEEKAVDNYPILAFSKGAKKAATGGEEGSDNEENPLKDYFRLYSVFMGEILPGNEKILLENGAYPSA